MEIRRNDSPDADSSLGETRQAAMATPAETHWMRAAGRQVRRYGRWLWTPGAGWGVVLLVLLFGTGRGPETTVLTVGDFDEDYEYTTPVRFSRPPLADSIREDYRIADCWIRSGRDQWGGPSHDIWLAVHPEFQLDKREVERICREVYMVAHDISQGLDSQFGEQFSTTYRRTPTWRIRVDVAPYAASSGWYASLDSGDPVLMPEYHFRAAMKSGRGENPNLSEGFLPRPGRKRLADLINK